MSAIVHRRRPAGFWLATAALGVLVVVSWYYLVAWPMPMPGEAGVRAPAYLWLTFVMWLVMMVAMMTPSAAPAVMLFHRVQRGSWARTAAFLAGYFIAWAGFSLGATLAQLALIEAGGIDAMGVAANRWMAAALLAVAAIWQWLPVKEACLRQCRSPAEFLASHYHPGVTGAIHTGIRHGAYCVGCCWALMLLLFVGGVMSVVWISGLTLLVALEKLAPGGQFWRGLYAVTLLVAACAVALGVPFA
jgi:predicted metal-binding membrane protein